MCGFLFVDFLGRGLGFFSWWVFVGVLGFLVGGGCLFFLSIGNDFFSVFLSVGFQCVFQEGVERKCF